VNVLLPLTFCIEALIVVVPPVMPCAMPPLEIVATALLEDSQVT
jgi:hypothetical protein